MNTPHILGQTRQIARLGKLLSSGSHPHALLFTGPSGIGKRTAAAAFVSALFCTGEKKPCGTCPSCAQIRAGTFPDLHMIGPNESGVVPVGSSDKPEPGSARWIIHKLAMKPVGGKAGAVIDGIDRMHGDVQNVLLKTIEEPGEGTCLVLIASERSRVLPTILSRCVEIRFSPLNEETIRELIKGKNDSGDVLDFASAASGGSVENAIALCDDDYREDIVDACREITQSMVSGSSLNVASSLLSKPKQTADSVEILIAAYHHMLRRRARGEAAASALFDDINIDDIPVLCSIIKMLLAVKKGRANNLNAGLQLKALAYRSNNSDLPDPPFSAQL